ncbi:LAME_0E07624g1_1 [Lachancea meyersii CBS 8951]|uniref:LAME_0E07624g1_1 n=1 Tax=Lachancea meyersii CBS 8951 TaxID=1266667 RepID=A0A1G4JIE0_9SACH|nr:LAME_0E07624g1_1 [Lachancea meyersii CBS 8951]
MPSVTGFWFRSQTLALVLRKFWLYEKTFRLLTELDASDTATGTDSMDSENSGTKARNAIEIIDVWEELRDLGKAWEPLSTDVKILNSLARYLKRNPEVKAKFEKTRIATRKSFCDELKRCMIVTEEIRVEEPGLCHNDGCITSEITFHRYPFIKTCWTSARARVDKRSGELKDVDFVFICVFLN